MKILTGTSLPNPPRCYLWLQQKKDFRAFDSRAIKMFDEIR